MKETMIFEDKLIVENALSLWVGCIFHKPELINDFYAFRSATVPSCKDLILKGLLFCNQEKVREEFKVSLSALAKSHGKKLSELPLLFLLRVMSENFSLIS
jgi:hypothetical protein